MSSGNSKTSGQYYFHAVSYTHLDVYKRQRYTHTVSVAQTAAKLAKLYGCDADQAYLAGLMHDYARDLSPTELLTIAQENDLIADHAEVISPDLLHGVAGAFLLKKEGLITDEAILQAIRYHTTGHPKMSNCLLYTSRCV